MTERQEKLLRRVGFPVLAVVAFIYALHLSFPYERLINGALANSSVSLDYDDVSACFIPGCVRLENPTASWSSGEVSAEELTVNVSIMRGLFSGFSTLAGDVDMDFGDGVIETEFKIDGKGTSKLSVETNKLETSKVPNVEKVMGIPLAGPLDANIQLSFPSKKGRVLWERPTGKVKLRCKDCEMGDGVETVEFAMSPKADAEVVKMEVPRLELGDFGGELDVKNGTITFNDFGSQSPDGELSVNGTLKLAKKSKAWDFDQCWKFSVSEKVKEFVVEGGEGEEAQKVGEIFYRAVNGYPKQSDSKVHMKWFGKLGNRRSRRIRLPDRPCELGKKKKPPRKNRTIRKPKSSKSSSSKSTSSESSKTSSSSSSTNSKGKIADELRPRRGPDVNRRNRDERADDREEVGDYIDDGRSDDIRGDDDRDRDDRDVEFPSEQDGDGEPLPPIID